MVDVRVDEMELNKSKDGLIEHFSQLVDTKATIEKMTADLAGFWSGPEHDKFSSMMTDSLDIIQGEFNKVTKYLDYLTELCKVYDSYSALSKVSVLEKDAVPAREDRVVEAQDDSAGEVLEDTEQVTYSQEAQSGQKKQAPISM